jgi:hypothetical protein
MFGANYMSNGGQPPPADILSYFIFHNTTSVHAPAIFMNVRSGTRGQQVSPASQFYRFRAFHYAHCVGRSPPPGPRPHLPPPLSPHPLPWSCLPVPCS